jgi:hypothetical protein
MNFEVYCDESGLEALTRIGHKKTLMRFSVRDLCSFQTEGKEQGKDIIYIH